MECDVTNFFNELVEDLFDEMADKIPYIKGKPVYSLRECLNFKGIDELRQIYEEVYRKKASKKTKEKLLDDICLRLPEFFVSVLALGIIGDVDFYIKNNEPNLIMLSMGFQFCFKYKNKKIFVVPDELKVVYEKCSQKNGEIASEQFLSYMGFYLNVNGIVSRDFVKDVIKKYHLNMDVSSAEKLLMDNNVQIMYDDYFIITPKSVDINKDDFDKKINDLIEIKKKQTYKFLSIDEILDYTAFIDGVNVELNDLLNTDNVDYVSIFGTNYEKMDQILEMVSKDFKLSKKAKKILKETIDENKDDIRYWHFNGRTLTEYEEEICVKEMMMLEKPKDNSLKGCLNCLSKGALKLLCKQYQSKDIDELAGDIICNFGDEVVDYEIEDLTFISRCNNKEIDYSLTYEIKNGYVFAYQDKKKIKTVLPKEIKKILDNTNIW